MFGKVRPNPADECDALHEALRASLAHLTANGSAASRRRCSYRKAVSERFQDIPEEARTAFEQHLSCRCITYVRGERWAWYR